MRTDLEHLVLEPFEEVAREASLAVYKGQGGTNRVPIEGLVCYQFGDLRVDLTDRHIIVEVESAGGVTNLLKYWDCLTTGLIERPVYLLHGFRQGSANDYASHIRLWHFIYQRMKNDLDDRFNARLFTYRGDHLREDVAPACTQFKEWIRAADG